MKPPHCLIPSALARSIALPRHLADRKRVPAPFSARAWMSERRALVAALRADGAAA